ncbi:MAG: hypothetical protein QOH25_3312 [Acidobacteriota bacterium]|nr:hypothetical protein [Acidobacteriota bacterium]
MDERAINGAAIEAIKDLELDCEIKEVRQAGSENEWCIQFSDKYGQFCDDFKNQFGKENSPQVIREKIKSHLIKQVNKIRSGTGRKRKPAATATNESRQPESGILAAPLKMIGEVFGRASGIAGEVINQASTLAETARDTVSEAAANLSPVTIEVRSTTTRARQKRASGSARKKPVKAARATPAKAKQASKRVTRQAGKQAKKTGKVAGKTASRAKKAKTTKKTLRRGK